MRRFYQDIISLPKGIYKFFYCLPFVIKHTFRSGEKEDDRNFFNNNNSLQRWWDITIFNLTITFFCTIFAALVFGYIATTFGEKVQP
jgi:hypothetical protein